MRNFTAPLLLLAVALAPACADDDKPFVVLRNNAPGTSACVETPSESALGVSRGLADATHGDYLLLPLLKNFADSKNDSLTAQRTVFIEGARVDVAFSDPDLFTAAELETLRDDGLTRFETRNSWSIEPDGGLASLSSLLLPRDLLAAIGAKLGDGETTLVQTTSTFFGTMGGGDVEAAPFSFSVEVCNGCLSVNAGTCPLPDGTTVETGGSCGFGEITCCTDDTGAQICPATIAPPEG